MSADIGCSHMRSILLFTESVRSSCRFKACCDSCALKCTSMGLNVDRDVHGSYHLTTNSASPFCKGWPILINWIWQVETSSTNCWIDSLKFNKVMVQCLEILNEACHFFLLKKLFFFFGQIKAVLHYGVIFKTNLKYIINLSFSNT